MLSRVSLATGVTASEDSTYTNTPCLLSTPEILSQSELPIPPNHFTLGLCVPSGSSASSSRLVNFNHPPLAGHLTPDQVLAQVRSGVDLDDLVFSEGNITFQRLRNIDHNANPHLYSKLSVTADDNYEPPHHKDPETEQEEEEEHPLPIPGPSCPLPIHLTTQELEQFSSEQS